MNVRGERILIFGDSLSKHGSDSSPEVWDVNQGFMRSSSAPGDLLASLLAEQGAEAVRTNARVSRSAWNFWQRENADALITGDLAWKPSKIIIILGTNDADSGVDITKDMQSMTAIRDAYAQGDAEVWAIGPFISKIDPGKVELVAQMMAGVFGYRFIDGRALTELAQHSGDGVHYTQAGARTLAMAMAKALVSRPSPSTIWNGIAIGAVGLVGAIGVYAAVKRARSKQPLLAGAGGQCFPWAFEHVQNGGALAHGTVKHPYDGHAYEHAWIERDGRVYDWQSDQGLGPGRDGWPREDFYRAFTPTKIKRYTGEQAAKSKWLCHGPMLKGPDDDDDFPQEGEDDEKWWERINRKASEAKRPMRKALAKHDAVIVTSGTRQVLLVKTPEMSNKDEGSIRITAFDEDGPIGHTTRDSLDKLAEEMHSDWGSKDLRPATEDEIIEWTGTERFARGSEAVARIQRENAGLKSGSYQAGDYFIKRVKHDGKTSHQLFQFFPERGWEAITSFKSEKGALKYVASGKHPPREVQPPPEFKGLSGKLEDEVTRIVDDRDAWPDLAEIRKRQPRPLHKFYGPNPTPEQIATHKAEMSTWNSEYRKASKLYKALVEESNSRLRSS